MILKSASFLLILLLFTSEIQAQAQLNSEVVWKESFDVSTPKWKQSYNQDELFLIQAGEYAVWRKSSVSPSFIFPEDFPELAQVKLEIEIVLAANVKNNSAGFVLMSSASGESLLLIEINDNQEFRIRRLYNHVFTELSGDKKNAGWVKFKGLKKGGNVNFISGNFASRELTLFINEQEALKVENLDLKPGKIGLYIGSSSKATFDQLIAYTSSKEVERLKSEQAKNDAGINALTDVIKSLRNTIKMQNEELDSLNKLIDKYQKVQTDQDQNPNSLKNIKQELNNKRKEISELEKKLELLEKENQSLQKFKKNIEASKGGDLVVKLSSNLAAEQLKNEQLQQRIKALEEQIIDLKNKQKKLYGEE